MPPNVIITGIVGYYFYRNYLPSVPVKEFLARSIFDVAYVFLQISLTFLHSYNSLIINGISRKHSTRQCPVIIQESPANAKGTRDSSACMKAHCEQM